MNGVKINCAFKEEKGLGKEVVLPAIPRIGELVGLRDYPNTMFPVIGVGYVEGYSDVMVILSKEGAKT